MWYVTTLISIFLLFGCSSKSNLKPTSYSEIEGFYEDNLSETFTLFKQNCQKLNKFDDFKKLCKKAERENINPYNFFTQNFKPYILIDNENNQYGEITGYYEPILKASLTKNKTFKYPIYKMPKHEVYLSKEQIDKSSNFEAIAYTNSKSDLYLLHLQGSGKLILEDGETLHLIYSGSNNKKFTSIGEYMINKGYILSHEATIQGVKEYLDKNPKKVDEILNQNERYIFFKVAQKSLKGTLGLDLISKRTIAVDTNYINLGLPVFLQTKNPITKEKINRLVLANDTGIAIKGKIRADYFWGSGKNALKYAGRMKEKGRLIILMPK